MKKLKFLLPILLSLVFSVFASAADVSYTSQAPWQYGEMKDGLFVRTIEEELSWIDFDDPNYDAELILCRESRYLEELTPEMEALGYMLADGMAIPPEGDSTETENSIVVSGSKAESGMTSSGQVIFNGVIDSDITEICFIEVKNTTTGNVYLINLYRENNYSRTVEFPEGDYIVLSGGIYNDYTSKYPFESENFVVKNGSSAFVVVKIGSTDSEKAAAAETKETLEIIPDEIEAEDPEPVGNVGKSSKSLLLSIIQPILIIIIAVVAFKLYQRKKDADD